MKSKTAILVFFGLLTVIGITFAVATLVPYVRFRQYSPEAGDMIFQSLPRNELVVAIEGATNSPYSHCGIVVKREGKWSVLEAIGPVKYTPLYRWVNQGRKSNFAVFRLKAPHRALIPAFLEKAAQYKGRPYDSHYDMDDEKIYCSELLFKAFRDASGKQLAETEKLGSLNWKPYEQTIRRLEDGNLPLEREMVTPARIVESPMVELVIHVGI